MSKEYPFIPDHLIRALEDTSIPLVDILHGELKNMMYEMQNKDFDNKDWAEGYQDALVDLYCLTYNLSIDRANLTPISA